MNFKEQILRFFLTFLVLSSLSIYSSRILGVTSVQVISNYKDTINKSSGEVGRLNALLKSSLTAGDSANSRLLIERIIHITEKEKITESIRSESFYYAGIYYLQKEGNNEAIRYLDSCLFLKAKLGEFDGRYARALYNIGIAYLNLGDFKKHEEYALNSLEIEKKINGESSPVLAATYLSLIIAYIELQEYDKAVYYSNIALSIANSKPENISPAVTADIYINLGVCYTRLADFSKAKIYLDKAESHYKQFRLKKTDNYINLMNSSAITYGALGFTAGSEVYYKKVIALALANNSPVAYNIINSYALFLAANNNIPKGEKLLREALERAKARYDMFPRNYIEVLNNYAIYLRVNRIDNNKSLEYFEQCLEYLQKNNQELFLKTSVLIGYSLSLEEAGEYEKALETIQSLLLPGKDNKRSNENFKNPGIEQLKPDRVTLTILETKYRILCDLFKKSADQEILEAASNTSELIVSLIEKVRITISEDDSRLLLGDRYRDSYLNAIHDFYLLFRKTNDPHHLEKAFEYCEKSKVAGLLTSTRELKATQLHIPSVIGDYEKKLQSNISLFNARLTEETTSARPNSVRINKLKENLFEATRSRDSLILVFEKKYPVYYSIKYNTHVAELKNIPKIVGRNGNYINYILSDTLLYTFISNRSYRQLLALPVDSSFYNDIRRFRNLLSMPSPMVNASVKFKDFQEVGNRLYKTLIDPIRPYLISDKIFISPDNILSYLPFEIIPSTTVSNEDFKYRDLSYLMNSYDISYTYSATFMEESANREYSRRNELIAFAPDYPDPIDIRSTLMTRQAEMGTMKDLPYARDEAKFVSDITGGRLLKNSDAKESVYKNESGNYDIIHLAMHTFLNDKDPMNSTLIFSHANDSLEDGYLKTFEIYGIPLKAKMVVLSSCNTGTGMLYSGEGILSVARGFIYSGSQSVIMSMWEIEDKSGTAIVELFYKNLKKGQSKSIALKNARIAFLKNADNLRSHPYYWSALVVYGNNSPLYYSAALKITFVIVVAIFLLSVVFYFRK